MCNKIIICFTFLFFLNVFCQSPQIDWQRTIGGNNRDIITCSVNTNDNGILIGGNSESNISGEKNQNSRGGTDIWILKLTQNGIIEWQKTIGGNNEDTLNSIIKTNDGGYLLGGVSNSNISGEKTENNRGGTDIWVLKLNSTGIIEWQKTIGGSGADGVISLCNTSDGGYIIGASTFLSGISGEKTIPDFGGIDFWVLKIDDLGNIIWQTIYGGIYDDEITSVNQTLNGDIIISGQSNSTISGNKDENSIDWDYWVIKTNSTGAIIWQNTIGGDNSELSPKLIITSDNDYMIGGTSFSSISGDKTENNYGDRDFWVLKVDQNGQIIWDKTIGGGELDKFELIEEITNNNYLVGGSSYSNISGIKTQLSNGLSDLWMVKINSLGNIIWDKTIGGSNVDTLNSISIINNSIIIGGTSFSGISGDKTEVSRGLNDFWIIKLKPENLATHNFESAVVSLYPNPTTETVYFDFTETFSLLKARTFNLLGQLINDKKVQNTSNLVIDINGESGVYFIEIENENNEKKTFKILKN